MIHSLLEQLYQGKSLSLEQSQQLFGKIISGEVEPILLSSLLTV